MTPQRPTIEDVRVFWDARPCNIRHSDKAVGTREYFDEVERRKYFVEPHIPGFAQFERWTGKQVLEVGCGIGTDAVNFARRGAVYTGVELSEASLSLARQRFAVYGLEGQFVLGNAEQLGDLLPAGRFDLVYAFGVLHHTPRPERAVAQIRRLTKDDGEFRLMLYAANSWKAIMIEAGFEQAEAQSGVPIARTYTPEEARALLEGGGFDVVEVTQDHIFPYIVEKYLRYQYERQPWFAAMPPEAFRALERRLGWHMLIVARPRPQS